VADGLSEMVTYLLNNPFNGNLTYVFVIYSDGVLFKFGANSLSYHYVQFFWRDGGHTVRGPRAWDPPKLHLRWLNMEGRWPHRPRSQSLGPSKIAFALAEPGGTVAHRPRSQGLGPSIIAFALAEHGGTVASPSAVPEPGTLHDRCGMFL
jgi:hypothetical protein